MTIFEQLIARAWNRFAGYGKAPREDGGTTIGLAVVDGEVTQTYRRIADGKRTEHIAILGKTGSGKSSLLRYLSQQDIRENRGFVHFDLHGDTTPYLINLIAREERRRGADLSTRLIVIEPADPDYSVGLNVLAHRPGQQSFVQVAEFAQILKHRWHLDSFGARTEELLRNSLHVLSANNLTLLELAPLLTNAAFRTTCLAGIDNPEASAYFASRYDQASEAMQGVMRDAVLNKTSSFTADPHFRHVLGQQQSTFSLSDAIDRGLWIVLNLDKGRLGEQAATLGSLFLAQVKNALFARRTRNLFTLYCDELQNLVAYDSGLETLLSEARKFGTGVISANQYLDQYPAGMRSAVLSVATHIFFQLSGPDADKVAAMLDGGKSLAELLKNLPPRNFVVKSGHDRWRRGVVPTLESRSEVNWDLYDRCRRRWARPRAQIEQEIRARLGNAARSSNEVLRDWE